MKNIAIFCDGTWNAYKAVNSTNVVRLSQAVEPTSVVETEEGPKTVLQRAFYVEGVGNGRGVTALDRWGDKILGGAMGWGLNENILKAYRALAFNYDPGDKDRPGDKIYLFGFSRGAFTARSLAGLIRICGIPPLERIDQIEAMMAHYRNPGRKRDPDHENNVRFRQKNSPFVATSDDDAAARGGLPKVDIAYVGVWDTVGTLGVPGHWTSATLLNRRHQFHDLKLSRLVGAARHAVAVDERRRTFEPTLWDNLEERNIAVMGEGAYKAARAKSEADPDTGDGEMPFLQKWFAGDHGSVGGGGDIIGLSSITLDWVAEGARKAGLSLDPARDGGVTELRQRPDGTFERGWVSAKEGINPMAPTYNRKEEPGLFAKALSYTARDREGPLDVADVARFVALRWRDGFPEYRPGALNDLRSELTGLVLTDPKWGSD